MPAIVDVTLDYLEATYSVRPGSGLVPGATASHGRLVYGNRADQIRSRRSPGCLDNVVEQFPSRAAQAKALANDMLNTMSGRLFNCMAASA